MRRPAQNSGSKERLCHAGLQMLLLKGNQSPDNLRKAHRLLGNASADAKRHDKKLVCTGCGDAAKGRSLLSCNTCDPTEGPRLAAIHWPSVLLELLALVAA